MTDDFHIQTQALIHRIERKDQKFRLFQTVSLLVVAFGVIALLILNYNVQSQNHKLLDSQAALTDQLKTSVKNLESNNDTKLSDLQSHIDCIVSFFGLPNRAQLKIADVCHFQPSDNVSATPVASSSSASPKPSKVFVSSAPPQSTSSQPDKQTNKPLPPLPTPQPQGFLQQLIGGVKKLL